MASHLLLKLSVFAIVAVLFVQAYPRECGVNEEFVTCGTACPDKCGEDPNAIKVCTMQCVIGCQCRRGFVRRESDNACVRREEC